MELHNSYCATFAKLTLMTLFPKFTYLIFHIVLFLFLITLSGTPRTRNKSNLGGLLCLDPQRVLALARSVQVTCSLRGKETALEVRTGSHSSTNDLTPVTVFTIASVESKPLSRDWQALGAKKPVLP